jgi:hypothetical protein
MPSSGKRRRKKQQKQAIVPLTGGKDMAEKHGRSSASTSTDPSASWRHDMREFVADYIGASEKLAKGVLAFQERVTAWAKDTPWASFFNAQRDIATQWIEGAANLTRKLWRIEEEAAERTEEAITQFSKGEA